LSGLLVTGLALAASVGALGLMLLWLRGKVARVRLGGLDPRSLEVVGRVGLQANQGLALVRVGQRFLLVSSGEGGARMLTEVSKEDLEARASLGSEEEGAARRDSAGGGRPGRVFSLALERAVSGGRVRFMEEARPGGTARSGKGARSGRPSVVRRVGARLGLSVLASVAVVVASPGEVAAFQEPPPVQGTDRTGVDARGELGSFFEAMPRVSVQLGEDDEGLRLSGTVGTVIVLGLLSMAPTFLLLTTSFTRILIVLHLLRQALGTQSTPPGHLLAGLAILLTGAVMAPTLQEVRVTAVDPWLAGEIEEGTALRLAAEPLRYWMHSQTRDQDLRTFIRISRIAPAGPEDVPTSVLMSAFVTSELRTAFEIGFAVFLPFIVIDLVVAAVLTSMGMFMLPPTMIALPCKLMLFVLMDGWTLLIGTLTESFL